MRGCLALIQPWSPAAGARVNIYVGACLNAQTLGCGGFTWLTALTSLPAYAMEFISDDFDGALMLGSGRMTINQSLLGRQNPGELQWVGAPITIYAGDGTVMTDLEVEFDGIITDGSPNVDDNRVALAFTVNKQFLDVPLLISDFTGGGGVNGDTETRGQHKPAGFGSPVGVPIEFFDAVNQVALLDAYGNLTSVTAVYEGGGDMGASFGDYASYAALIAAPIPEGRWGTWLAGGMVRFKSKPQGVLTCDPVFGYGTPGAAMQRWMTTHAGVAVGKIRTSDFTGLDSALTTLLGASPAIDWWTDGDDNVLDLMQMLCASCNASPLLMLNGTIGVTRAVGGSVGLTLQMQGGTPLVTDWKSLDPTIPYWKMRMEAARTYRVHNPNEILYEDDLIDRGDYDAGQTYRQGHIATNPADGIQYIWKAALPGNVAPPNATYWDVYKTAITTGALGVEKFATRGDNLVFNGDASQGLSGLLTDATIGAGGTLALAATSEAIGGDKSFKIDKAATADGIYVLFRQIAVIPGEKMVFRAKVYGSAATSAGLYLRINERNVKAELASGYVTIGFANTTTDLVQEGPVSTSIVAHEYPYTVPAGVYWISVAVINWGGGPLRMIFDDVSLMRATTWNSGITGLGKPTDYADVTSANTAQYVQGQTAFTTLAAGTSLDNSVFGMPTRFGAFPGDVNFLQASRVAWDTTGNTVQNFKPQEAGANITENRTAAYIYNQGALAIQSAVRYQQQITGLPSTAERFWDMNYADLTAFALDWTYTVTASVSFPAANDTGGKTVQIIRGATFVDLTPNEWMAYVPTDLYEVIFDIEFGTQDAFTQVYLGVQGVDKAGNNLGSSYNYVAANGTAAGQFANTRQIFKGYFKGYTAAQGSGASSDPSAPVGLPDGTHAAFGYGQGGVVKIRPMALPNFASTTSTNSIKIHSVKLRRLAGAVATLTDVKFGSPYLREPDGTIAANAAYKTSLGTALYIANQTAFATLASGTSLDNPVFGMVSRLAPHADYGSPYLNSTSIVFSFASGGATVQDLRPQEFGSNKTETRTALYIQGQTTFTTLAAGTSLDNSVFGMPGRLGGHPDHGLSYLRADTLAYSSASGAGTAQGLRPQELGANVTENRTAQYIANQGPGAIASAADVLNNQTDASVTFVAMPTGAAYASGSGTTGGLRITLPRGYTNTMLRFWIDIYEYDNGGQGGYSCSYLVGGYTYETGNWINTFAQYIGPRNRARAVRFGDASGKCVVQIGETTDTWSYPQVRVRDFIAGYSQAAAADWKAGWSLGTSVVNPSNVTSTITTPNSGNPVFGENLLETPSILATLAAFKTNQGTAQYFSGQTAWATLTVTTARLTYLLDSGRMTLGVGKGITDEAQSQWITDAIAITSLGTALYIAGQGSGATANSLAGLNSAEGSKLAGIATGADVTATAIAAGLPGTTPVAGTGMTLAQIASAAGSGGGLNINAGVPSSHVVVLNIGQTISIDYSWAATRTSGGGNVQFSATLTIQGGALQQTSLGDAEFIGPSDPGSMSGTVTLTNSTGVKQSFVVACAVTPTSGGLAYSPQAQNYVVITG